MRPQIWLIVSAALLFSFGLLMVFNTTSAEIIDRSLETNTHAALLKQLLYGSFGIAFGSLAYWLGYESILKNSKPLLIAASFLLLLLFIPGIGLTINGSRRWLGILGHPIGQPSECIKILLPAAFIHWFLSQENAIDLRTFLKGLAWFSLPILFILLEPDNGTAAILVSLFVVLFFLTQIRWSYWALPLILLTGTGAIAAYQLPYVRGRIEIYLHPELDLRGKGHQPHQAKIAAGSGKLFGRGFGESLQKLNYLPEARSDYIAAIYAEEMGFIGIIILIGLYGVFTFSGFAIAFNAISRGGFFFASLLTFLIAIQAFLNLGIVSGLLPSKGTTLPFFSQGGSSLIVNITALFLILDIARKSVRENLHSIRKKNQMHSPSTALHSGFDHEN